MESQKEIDLVELAFEVIEENVPIDCEDVIREIRRKFFKDVRDLGFEEALKKWSKSEDDVEVILS
ncbi:hypothetical protein SJAV_20650 [Sulfurisphaera javensis]|uniref:Uncharacterized protein n=1 Tax=Sulfurisphaera javensis TaxID=2049879 RepID=A0AAT9GT42_9CREN